MALLASWPVWGEGLLPMLLLVGGGVLLLLLIPLARDRATALSCPVSLAVVLAALVFAGRSWWWGGNLLIAGLLFDRFAFLLDLIFLTALLVSLFFSRDTLRESRIESPEFYALLLFATAGLILVAHGGDLLLIFLGIEVVSLASYILAGFRRGSVKSCEASLKYFVLGSFASGFLLYGIALAFGAVGSTSLSALSGISDNGLLVVALVLLLAGLAFKVAAVPFHFWAPDVYEGAPTPVTGFMASAIKAGGFAALLRVLVSLHLAPDLSWVPFFWGLSALTMTVGNLMALHQTNIKRMLAYSSVAHAGYLLVGVTAALQDPTLAETSLAAVVFYLFAYSAMTLGAFGSVVALGRRREHPDEMEELFDYTDLAARQPVLAAVLSVFLLSLIGLPPTIGFTGKFYLFAGAIEAGLYGLVIVAVLNSVVSVAYYLAPVIKMYFQKGRGFELKPLSQLLLVGLFLCLFAVVYLGIVPSGLFLMARESVGEMIF